MRTSRSSYSQQSLYEEIYKVVSLIPKGKVATYGDIAYLVGNAKLARVVGNALHVNPQPGIVPCHRVVNRQGKPSGSFAFGGLHRQEELLQAEGVIFVNNHVDMTLCHWNFDALGFDEVKQVDSSCPLG